MLDSRSIVRTYLLTVTALTSLVSTRIYGTSVAPEGVALPLVTMQRLGGPGSHWVIGGYIEPSISFKCWSNTPAGAEALYEALFDALNVIRSTTVGSNVIKYAVENAAAQDFADLDSERFYVQTSWRFGIN